MSNPIFIARQDTLDEKIIPAQLLNDYKLHGEYSFVFHTPELWHKMCTHAYAANDQKVNGDALEYVLTKAAPTGSYSLSNWMALRAFAASKHWNSTVKENDMAIAKAAVALANSNEFSAISSCAEMAENSTAMSVLADSATARTALMGSSYYGKYMQNDTMCIAKLVVGFANLASAGYSSMAGVAADATAMNAVAASSTAVNAVAASSTAMNAVAASSTAMNAVAASTTAMDALYARKKQMKGGSASKSGKFIILEISASNAFDTSKYGYVTLSDGSKPDWSSYLAKYAFFQKYPKYATYMRNDTDSDDYIYYFDITNP